MSQRNHTFIAWPFHQSLAAQPLSPLSPHLLWHNGITVAATAPALWRYKRHYCGLHNICTPTDSSAGDGGRGDGRRWQCSAALGEKKNLIYSLPQRSGWRTRSEHLSDKSVLGCWQSTYGLHLLWAAQPVKWLNCARAEIDRTHERSVKVQVLFELRSLWNIKNVRMQHASWNIQGYCQQPAILQLVGGAAYLACVRVKIPQSCCFFQRCLIYPQNTWDVETRSTCRHGNQHLNQVNLISDLWRWALTHLMAEASRYSWVVWVRPRSGVGSTDVRATLKSSR